MADLLEWWNLIYALAFFFALLYVVLSVAGLAGHEAHADVGGHVDMHVDADAHVDVDAHPDLDAHVDVDAHPDVDFHVDVPAGGHLDAAHGMDHGGPDFVHEIDHHVLAAGKALGDARLGLLNEALSFLGIGRVPLSILLMAFLITFSIIGWSINQILMPWVRTPAIFFPISCVSAFVLGICAMKLVASVLGRYLKPIETAAVSRTSLTGRIGTTSIVVTPTFGQVLVRDDHGTQHKVVCRVAEDAETIPAGRRVLLIRFTREDVGRGPVRGYYLVEPYDVTAKA